jgi:manganese/zinc/iron transport system permease protein
VILAAAELPFPAGWIPPYNTLVVAAGVASVGFAAGVVGCFAVLRRRALAGDAAAHATLLGVGLAFLLGGGRRDLPLLLGGALSTAIAALAGLVLIGRWTRTREDAATAIVLGVSFGAGITLLSGISARGIPGSAGLEQFLLGHTAGLTAADAMILGVLSLLAVALVTLFLKESTLVAFDPSFAAASGWPVTLIDYALVVLVAVMVVVGLPAAGAVLVTALVVIPPVTARQWTDRVGVMLPLSGLFGLVAALSGVAISSAVPRMPTGPLVVIAASLLLTISLLLAPRRGGLARWLQARRTAAAWAEGRLLEVALRLEGEGPFTREQLLARAPGAAVDRAFKRLVRTAAMEPVVTRSGAHAWRLAVWGRELAAERARRLAAWTEVLEAAREDARGHLTLDVPSPEAILGAARMKAIREAASVARNAASQSWTGSETLP